jgi:hypothetical protein
VVPSAARATAPPLPRPRAAARAASSIEFFGGTGIRAADALPPVRMPLAPPGVSKASFGCCCAGGRSAGWICGGAVGAPTPGGSFEATSNGSGSFTSIFGASIGFGCAAGAGPGTGIRTDGRVCAVTGGAGCGLGDGVASSLSRVKSAAALGCDGARGLINSGGITSGVSRKVVEPPCWPG